MAVQILCPNPECRTSFGATEAGRVENCPSCGWKIPLVDERSEVAETQHRPLDHPLLSSHDLPSSESPWELPKGSLLGERYRVIRKLGEGGMGAVYLAEDSKLKRKVALKVPHPYLYENNPNFLERLYREAQIAAGFHNPRICPIYDVDHSGGWHYIVMHYIEGLTLADKLKHRAVDPAEALRIVRSVAETLQDAHAKDIIHRDLKPSNLMFGRGDDPIIMDFGLAKRIDGDGDDPLKTSHGLFMGTLVYASAEQVECRHEDLGPACDIYTLGVILYELLTGQLPYRGPRWSLMAQILAGEAVPPSAHSSHLDPDLDAIVLKAMAVKIEDRFLSMAEFAGAIDAYHKKLHRPATSPTVVTVTPTLEDARAFADTITAPVQTDLKASREISHPLTGTKLVLIDSGEFTMGSLDGDADERPPHKVRISKPFIWVDAV